MPIQFPDNYLRFNSLSTKNIVIVVEIDGLDLLSNTTVFTKIRYGDPNVFYGTPFSDGSIPIYGGLRRLAGTRDILSLDGSNITISQKLEPEQGRGAISTMSLSFVDKDQYMTMAVSPGVLIPDILGAKVKVWIGYQEISYPEDYAVIFRGRVSDYSSASGLISLQFSDPNINRKQDVFTPGKTQLITPIDVADTDFDVVNNGDFFQQILGPNGTYDVANPWLPDGTFNVLAPKRTGVRTFLKIENEYIEYGPLGFGVNSFSNTLRGARGTTAAAHATGADVSAAIQIQDHAIDMALKLMLSGWGDNWITDVPIFSIQKTFDPTLLDQPKALILPDKVNAIEDYGLSEGDYVTISGSAISGNNVTGRIVRFADLFDQPNRMIYIDQSLTSEYPTNAVMALRSQYDTYPVLCGGMLTPEDVDVDKHITLKNDFLSDQANSYRFFLDTNQSLKTFIESQIYLPISAYSLTQRGRLSVGYTKPPLADEQLIILDKDSVLNPESIVISRGLNSRKFFNEIDWDWDYGDDGNPTSFLKVLDTDSLNRIGVLTILPISSQGARTDLGTNQLFSKRSTFLLSRYRFGAAQINIKTNWENGCRIEAGDIIGIKDNGNLQITNISTGSRDLGTQLFEVLDRSLDLRQGQATLQLVAGIAYDVTDRYATVSPSSVLDVGSTATYIIVKDSYGSIFPGNETRKWKDYFNVPVVIHDENYTVSYSTTILRIDPINPYKMYVDPPLPMSLSSGLILDIPPYPDTAEKSDNAIYKVIHAFFSPLVQVSSGSSNTEFHVGSGDISKFFLDARIIVSQPDYTVVSPEVKVTSIVGTLVTVSQDLGFTPDNTYVVTGIGFPDEGGMYRYL